MILNIDLYYCNCKCQTGPTCGGKKHVLIQNTHRNTRQMIQCVQLEIQVMLIDQVKLRKTLQGLGNTVIITT